MTTGIRLNRYNELQFNGGAEFPEIEFNALTRVNDAGTAHSGSYYWERTGGPSSHFSTQTYTITEGVTKLRVAGWVRWPGTGDQPRFWLGWSPRNGSDSVVQPNNFWAPGGDSYAYLSRNHDAGETVLDVGAGEGTAFGGSNPFIAKNAELDGSDVPNYAIQQVASATANTITLSSGLTGALTSGTRLRRHQSASTYMYTAAANELVTTSWVQRSGVAGPSFFNRTASTLLFTEWWPGTVKARLVLLTNYPSGTMTMWADDLSVTDGNGPPNPAVISI